MANYLRHSTVSSTTAGAAFHFLHPQGLQLNHDFLFCSLIFIFFSPTFTFFLKVFPAAFLSKDPLKLQSQRAMVEKQVNYLDTSYIYQSQGFFFKTWIHPTLTSENTHKLSTFFFFILLMNFRFFTLKLQGFFSFSGLGSQVPESSDIKTASVHAPNSQQLWKIYTNTHLNILSHSKWEKK